MSLASIKQKDLKGKKNFLPKLRTILANPYKQHSPVLPDNELLEFQNILKAVIKESGHTPRQFLTQSKIHIGLDSTLRAINGQRFSCVFISLSLRPSNIVRLIATSAAAMIATAPVYAQPKLEELTYEVLGVRALTMVLPSELDRISPTLAQWVNSRKRQVVEKPIVTFSSSKPKRKWKPQTTKVEETLTKQDDMPSAENDWSGDYISCSNDGGTLQLDQIDVQTETQKLGAALSNMVMKSQSKTTVNSNTPKLQKIITPLPTVATMEVETDEDEFLAADLAKYRPLTVHQICPNVEKKPKKKRNKNKKLNQNKHQPSKKYI